MEKRPGFFKQLAPIAGGFFALALICAKVVGLFTDEMVWRSFPYLMAAVIVVFSAVALLLAQKRAGHTGGNAS